MSKTRSNLIITGIVIAAGCGMLMWAALGAQWSQTVSAQTLADSRGAFAGKEVQIYGKVAAGSIGAGNNGLDFVIMGDRGGRVPVRYIGKKIANLSDGCDVLVGGTADVNGITAQKVLTKCPSKYIDGKGGK